VWLLKKINGEKLSTFESQTDKDVGTSISLRYHSWFLPKKYKSIPMKFSLRPKKLDTYNDELTTDTSDGIMPIVNGYLQFIDGFTTV